MSLPENDTPWPPKPFDVAFNAMAGWDAWYTGDTNGLSSHYNGASLTRGSTFSQHGLVGVAKQFFWGRNSGTSEAKSRLHVPIAADVARTSADLIFAEPPAFILGDGKQDQKRITEMFGGSETAAELLEAGEIQSALGGCYVRIIWDKEAFFHVKFDVVHADGAIPEWRYGQLYAVTFWTILERAKGDKVVRHLERHSPGQIEHAVYVGTDSRIGFRTPLDEFPELEWAARSVNADSAILTGTDRLTARYVPNIRPNRIWRKSPGLAPLGRSDYDQLEGLLDAADEAYTSMMRELRLGKARAFVDRSILDSNGPGQGATFDVDQEVFSPLNGLGKLADGASIQSFQPEIRHAEHRAIIQDICATILRTAGYSGSDFGEDPLTGSMTATEVNQRRNLSMRTRDKKIQYWRTELEKLSMAAIEIERQVYGGTGLPADAVVNVKFPAKVGVDPLTMAQTIQTLDAAGAISLQEKLRRVNPNWDETKLGEEAKAITAERGNQVTDPFKITE